MELDSLDFRIQRTLLKAGNAINNTRDNELRVKNLTSAQSETILYYEKHEGGSIKDLAIYLKISHQAARKLVDKLQAKDILDIRISPYDKRYASISLTQTGQSLCKELKACGTLTGQYVLADFTETEKELLSGYLDRILANIARGPKPSS